MRLIIALCTLSLLGCHGKLRERLDEKKFKSSIPDAPAGASACTLQGEKVLEQNLQTKNPIPIAAIPGGKAYHVVWSRAEAVDIPDEGPSTAPSAEIGSLQSTKLSLSSKAALDIEKITSERSGTSEISVAQQSSLYSYFFEDEFGAHFFQRSNNKPTGPTFDIVGGHSPNLLSTKSGLWMFWTSACEGGGEIKFLKFAKDQTPDSARAQSADGILCGRGNLATASNGNKVAVSWLVKGFMDKKGRLTDNQIAVMFGDASTGTFEKPVFLTPAPGDPEKNPVAGPAISLSADGKEAAIAWLIEGQAVEFAAISSDGNTTVAPRLLASSYKAKDLAASIISDKTYHSLAWSDGANITLAVLDHKGAMATPPLIVGPGARPTILEGFSTKEKEYSIFYWRPSAASSSSKTLGQQQVTCFAKPKKTKKTKK